MGVCSALRTAGSIASTHRAPSHTIAKGDDINLTMAELFGRSNGNCHGKGGSMNIADISGGMLGAVAPWSLELPIFTGADPDVILEGGEGVSDEGRFMARRTWRPSGICRLPMYAKPIDGPRTTWRRYAPDGGRVGREQGGVALAAEVSVICGGSITISIESPAARPVSIASASAPSMVRPYPGWTRITRPTHRRRFKFGIHLRASVDTGKGRGEVQDVGCESRAGFLVGCAQAVIVGFGPGDDAHDVRSGNVAGPSSRTEVECFAEQ